MGNWILYIFQGRIFIITERTEPNDIRQNLGDTRIYIIFNYFKRQLCKDNDPFILPLTLHFLSFFFLQIFHPLLLYNNQIENWVKDSNSSEGKNANGS